MVGELDPLQFTVTRLDFLNVFFRSHDTSCAPNYDKTLCLPHLGCFNISHGL